MFAARRSAASARLLLRQQPRRYASDAHHHHHPEPVSEGFGPSFYIAVSTFAAGFVLYRITKSSDSDNSWITGLIKKYTPDEKVFEERNAIRTVAIEKAASDRHLFAGTPRREHIELRSPELFNTGSRLNVGAGSQADLSAVAAYYENHNKKLEEDRVSRLKDGKVVSIYD
ncbi:NADH-ubiquinone oxidoreductase 178 kDa subunit [Talaromyces proteolyticus]|uniref:NADH-ubiquinone oxidoreductase 178 kDa subunit n=1 Tax=Talaromyces proteolyticus TaxID=1131652 RepID=A0AAD4KZR9_9EURO|nr:NADH-ubiquinone oxidoreductase 178 kDa subunit [Talaromyces proteolyticus]KAH8701111.1 NADH-ubiquinone oxidoreductase 178 kDa subunit [Talaromyces proteolyticus]